MIRELRQPGLSLGAALALVGMARATYYRESRARPEDEWLKERIRELALAQATFGYRRITAVLRRQGWRINPKRVYRLYRQMDLQRPMTKKGRRGLKRPASFEPTEAHFPGQVWALDFIEDRLVSGRKVRLLNVIDIYSRYGLVTVGNVEGSMEAIVRARCPCSAGVKGHITDERISLEPRKPRRGLRLVTEGGVRQGTTGVWH